MPSSRPRGHRRSSSIASRRSPLIWPRMPACRSRWRRSARSRSPTRRKNSPKCCAMKPPGGRTWSRRSESIEWCCCRNSQLPLPLRVLGKRKVGVIGASLRGPPHFRLSSSAKADDPVITELGNWHSFASLARAGATGFPGYAENDGGGIVASGNDRRLLAPVKRAEQRVDGDGAWTERDENQQDRYPVD